MNRIDAWLGLIGYGFCLGAILLGSDTLKVFGFAGLVALYARHSAKYLFFALARCKSLPKKKPFLTISSFAAPVRDNFKKHKSTLAAVVAISLWLSVSSISLDSNEIPTLDDNPIWVLAPTDINSIA